MIWVSVCATCRQYRHKTGDIPNGQKPAPVDFVPQSADQAPITEAEPMLCGACGNALKLTRLPGQETAARTNGIRHDRPDVGPPDVSMGRPTVTTLFEARQDEDVREITSIGPDTYKIVTSKRLLVVDVSAVMKEMA